MSRRLYLSLPIGTFVVIGINVLFYMFVQRGLFDPYNPLWLPFASNSFSNPFGLVVSSWSHMSLDHLFSNMVATFVFAPLAELVFNTGANKTRVPVKGYLGSLFSSPRIRAVLLFPFLWFVVGVALSIGTPPGIGFSAILFAIIGFCAVLAPILIIVLLLVNIILNNIISVLLVPVEVTRMTTVVTEPTWAGIGIWAHLLGFLVGILIGVVYYFHRGGFKKPDPLYSFFAVLIVGLMMGLDLPFSYIADGEYVLFSAAGFILVVVLATLVYLYWRYVGLEETVKPAVDFGVLSRIMDAGRIWKVSLLLIFFLSLIISFSFAGAKLTMDTPEVPENAVEVEGYEFWFQQNEGILVYQDDREIYTLVASPADIVSEEKFHLYVGGLTVYERVDFYYYAINPVDGDSVGSVWIDSEHGVENLFTGGDRYTGITVYGQDIYVGFDVLNKSVSVQGIGEYPFNQTVVEGDEHTVEVGDLDLVLRMEEGIIYVESDDFTGPIAEVTGELPGQLHE
ncbi:rhomboid family intramembrane serine protease [Methanonatronarchaeum sp. AMET6-2]|uniref:rhomboid family intramembrane serine protease n=1 Tax=Methanonatronarchaeum sp. AMET6-2 TaxID=2933293 RepID=UPI0012192351|nr:MAG: rhomboid family intramembrane serine protease [Methanonatronarchaeia archaeon]